ncbi:hypothetical protein ACFL1V_06520 [Pseudomonadota bacterium]
MSENQLTIAVTGGNGNPGQGLACQLARAGYRGITGEPGIA